MSLGLKFGGVLGLVEGCDLWSIPKGPGSRHPIFMNDQSYKIYAMVFKSKQPGIGGGIVEILEIEEAKTLDQAMESVASHYRGRFRSQDGQELPFLSVMGLSMHKTSERASEAQIWASEAQNSVFQEIMALNIENYYYNTGALRERVVSWQERLRQ